MKSQRVQLPRAEQAQRPLLRSSAAPGGSRAGGARVEASTERCSIPTFQARPFKTRNTPATRPQSRFFKKPGLRSGLPQCPPSASARLGPRPRVDLTKPGCSTDPSERSATAGDSNSGRRTQPNPTHRDVRRPSTPALRLALLRRSRYSAFCPRILERMSMFCRLHSK